MRKERLSPEPDRSITEQTAWHRLLENPWDNLASQFPGIERSPEFVEVKKWYEEQVDNQPNYEISDAALEGEPWDAIYSAKGESKGNLLEIRRQDGEFFRLVGVDCRKTNQKTGEAIFQWTQPLLVGVETALHLKLFEKKTEVPVYGLLSVITDSNGNFLLTVGQEAASENRNHCVVRLPIQSSATKAANTIAGVPGGDAGILELLNIFECNNIDSLLKKAHAVFLECPEDPDRILKHNLVVVLPTIDFGSDLHKLLVFGGKRKWVSKNQLDMLTMSGLTNSHTTLCVEMAEKFNRLSGQAKDF